MSKLCSLQCFQRIDTIDHVLGVKFIILQLGWGIARQNLTWIQQTNNPVTDMLEFHLFKLPSYFMKYLTVRIYVLQQCTCTWMQRSIPLEGLSLYVLCPTLIFTSHPIHVCVNSFGSLTSEESHKFLLDQSHEMENIIKGGEIIAKLIQ